MRHFTSRLYQHPSIALLARSSVTLCRHPILLFIKFSSLESVAVCIVTNLLDVGVGLLSSASYFLRRLQQKNFTNNVVFIPSATPSEFGSILFDDVLYWTNVQIQLLRRSLQVTFKVTLQQSQLIQRIHRDGLYGCAIS